MPGETESLGIFTTRAACLARFSTVSRVTRHVNAGQSHPYPTDRIDILLVSAIEDSSRACTESFNTLSGYHQNPKLSKWVTDADKSLQLFMNRQSRRDACLAAKAPLAVEGRMCDNTTIKPF